MNQKPQAGYSILNFQTTLFGQLKNKNLLSTKKARNYLQAFHKTLRTEKVA
ncbi:hypothetical protein LEP1GSC016_2143 [Leptospira borgpetersenii serovar Hardjo-bovis str. Sponselee]|uniref:Uncharacterized protein n=1 Tax=Leptospira borgpetersenii serovar Hardjo-bovis str. Sponselee TaxID=1303729 RepID=M6BIH1_LEPBO|nr:hypothetical protein LEP1GSC016_2143 [Leptospira borgpetersenii serovar Hardjo-bovis str. Sponselee]